MNDNNKTKIKEKKEFSNEYLLFAFKMVIERKFNESAQSIGDILVLFEQNLLSVLDEEDQETKRSVVAVHDSISEHIDLMLSKYRNIICNDLEKLLKFEEVIAEKNNNTCNT